MGTLTFLLYVRAMLCVCADPGCLQNGGVFVYEKRAQRNRAVESPAHTLQFTACGTGAIYRAPGLL